MPDKITKPDYSQLPELSGIYRFYNSDDVLIYIGKAKNLKKRVSSYFNKSNALNRKTIKLVSEIQKIEFTIVNTEFDALLLENNFIKQYQPKYNILLKDDKTFPYISILKEPFPRIISTRKYEEGKGEYFGPFSSVHAMNNVLVLIRKLHKIRTCNYLLSPENIRGRKFKVCLEYHIGNCRGPCEAFQSADEYQKEIDQARNIIKGKLSIVAEHYKENMNAAAEKLDYEKAQHFKSKLEILEKFQAKSTVVNHQMTDIDVFSIVSNESNAYVNFIQVKEGAIIFSKNFEIKKKLEETDEEILTTAASDIRQTYKSENPLILSNVPLSVIDNNCTNQVPQIGDKKKLLLLSNKNVLQFKQQKEINKTEQKQKISESVQLLKKDLRLENLPLVIECFDNSNLQGSAPVAAMVQFVNGRPNKKNYRNFNIKTVQGPDDYASMHEIISRRYSKLLEDNSPLPGLIVVDGGKGQLSSAVQALKELGIYGKIPIIGIAKKLEEIYFPDDSLPLHLNKKSPSLFLLQKIRDEAHRFAIKFHRNKRSKGSLTSGLSNVKGIGKSTEQKLLKAFKSWDRIKMLSLDVLSNEIGESKAKIIYNTIKKEA